MRKLRSKLSVAVLLFAVTGCGNSMSSAPVVQNPKKIVVTESTADKAGSVKAGLPLILTAASECEEGEKVYYEVKEDGTFTYSLNEMLTGEEAGEKSSRKLSSEETESLGKLINETNMAKLAEADKAVAEDAPQTMECRIVEKLTLNDHVYDKNGRKFIHSEEYLKGLEKIKTRLDELKLAGGTSEESKRKNIIALGEPFALQIGRAAYINNEKVLLTLDSVVEDSRCPINALCIQPGQVSFKFILTKEDGSKADLVLTHKLGAKEGEALDVKKIDNFTFTMLEIEPASIKSPESMPKPEDYSVTLKVN